jgi:hypothetical protein
MTHPCAPQPTCSSPAPQPCTPHETWCQSQPHPCGDYSGCDGGHPSLSIGVDLDLHVALDFGPDCHAI